MFGELKDYLHGSFEAGLLGFIYYLWKRYIKPKQEKDKKEIETLREGKHKAEIENAKLAAENKHLEKKKK